MGAEKLNTSAPPHISTRDTYVTDPLRPRSFFSRLFLGSRLSFYPQVLWIIWTNSRKATKGIYDTAHWISSSYDIFRTLENVGVILEITGLEHLRGLNGPAVFVANHMSTLETFVLPYIISPVRPVTFVVKKSLLETPLFGPVMRSRNPVVVGRTNPREDLKAVLDEGTAKIAQGISIVIFPQSTRSAVFDPEQFNSLGVKLAVRAGVPLLPIALKTDAWGTGRIIKDFGRLDRTKKVHFAFGHPIQVQGKGAAEHQAVINFIRSHLEQWTREESQ